MGDRAQALVDLDDAIRRMRSMVVNTRSHLISQNNNFSHEEYMIFRHHVHELISAAMVVCDQYEKIFPPYIINGYSSHG